ncbi:MAG: 2-isopropylmalate synthase [Proteobacteria bacterium]|nr:2-isopropylmalate synthase [Pseudomonadota bacterium]
MPIEKYQAFPTIPLSDRQWPSKTITKAPSWCSVDLRDGNQALVNPMSLEKKLEMFQLLVEIGFKEIEIGFPSASQVEYEFLRTLIKRELIPGDVTIQVLTQAREHLIEKTFEALKGSKKAIVHLYNSTSTLQRKVVFGMERSQIKQIAVDGAKLLVKFAKEMEGTQLQFQYSPESFTGTELDFSLEVCEAVLEVWKPTRSNKAILNLPATVEMHTPNIHADQFEWFCRNLKNRDTVLISIHPHNDRGTAVAAAELALLAGADRVEGTLFGNGERTGNVDILTMALNMFSQGVDPRLDFTDINHVISVYEKCSELDVHVRHPYAGELVYTAFSGSHQDAINKGMHFFDAESSETKLWEVPYLPIDPQDVGRNYEAIIRINSQSGKGGIAYIMSSEYGLTLPKSMHPEFGNIVQRKTDQEGREIQPEEIFSCFQEEYIHRLTPYEFTSLKEVSTVMKDPEKSMGESTVTAHLNVNGEDIVINGSGNGPIDAFSNGIRDNGLVSFKLLTYEQSALDKSSKSEAVTYIQLESEKGHTFFGVGIDVNTSVSSFKAIISALNRIAAAYN